MHQLVECLLLTGSVTVFARYWQGAFFNENEYSEKEWISAKKINILKKISEQLIATEFFIKYLSFILQVKHILKGFEATVHYQFLLNAVFFLLSVYAINGMLSL